MIWTYQGRWSGLSSSPLAETAPTSPELRAWEPALLEIVADLQNDLAALGDEYARQRTLLDEQATQLRREAEGLEARDQPTPHGGSRRQLPTPKRPRPPGCAASFAPSWAWVPKRCPISALCSRCPTRRGRTPSRACWAAAASISSSRRSTMTRRWLSIAAAGTRTGCTAWACWTLSGWWQMPARHGPARWPARSRPITPPPAPSWT